MRVLILQFLLLIAPASFALEIIMVVAPGCYYCKKWEAEIAPIYPKTELNTLAPLRTVDKRDIEDEIETARPVIYTPTFILVDDGREINRLEGYQSEDFFWVLTEEMVANAIELAQ